MQPLPKIPGYELLTRLGGGVLTAVYAGRDLSDDSACAVKVIREDWEDQPTAVKLLQREARACLAVRHPHLVSLRRAHVTRPRPTTPARAAAARDPASGSVPPVVLPTCSATPPPWPTDPARRVGGV